MEYKRKKSRRRAKLESRASIRSERLIKNDIFVQMEISKRHDLPAPLMSELFVENIKKNSNYLKHNHSQICKFSF